MCLSLPRSSYSFSSVLLLPLGELVFAAVVSAVSIERPSAVAVAAADSRRSADSRHLLDGNTP